MHKNSFKLPEDLTIITCRNSGTMEDRIIDSLSGYEYKSILECSLEYLGIEGLVVLRDDRLPWRNTFKIEMVKNYLDLCTTRYVMFCDAIDVIFIDDPNRVIEIFKSHHCKMLFMSTTATSGYSCMPEVYKWVTGISKSRFLNSGVWIGNTEFVKTVFAEASKYINPHGATMYERESYIASSPKSYPIGGDDQDILRYIEPLFYPDLKVDYKNELAYRS